MQSATETLRNRNGSRFVTGVPSRGFRFRNASVTMARYVLAGMAVASTTSGSQRWTVVAMAAVTSVAVVAGLVLTFRSGSLEAWGFPGAPALWATAFLTLGLMIVRAQPRNGIGWLFLVGGMFSGLMFLGASIISAADTGGNSSEPLMLIGGLMAVSFPLALGAMFAAIIVFPSGRVETMFERVALIVLSVTSIGLWASAAVWAISAHLGSGGFDMDVDAEGVLGAVLAVFFFGWQLATLLSFAAFVLHFRRSAGVQRQQLKWLAYGGAVLAAIAFVSQVVFELFASKEVAQYSEVLLAAGVLIVPVSIGIGILRYRWFDIDRVINRTVVYATVVVLLIAVYAAAVFVLRSALPLEGDLAVVASTLAVVALFNPVRKRVQAFVDRRFYRSRYDARSVVEGFSQQLQGEFDVDVVADEWSAVVGQALQPTASGVWIRGRNDAGTAVR